MKAVFLIIGLLGFFIQELYSQCSQPGLKIQSEACNAPTNLEVKSVSCSEIKVGWTGNKEQTYIVKANSTDHVTNNLIELIASQPVCDNNGNYTSIIKVNEGSDISWSVQSICTIQQASLYSAEIKGNDAFAPFCNKIKDTINSAFRVYPDPAPGYLIVEYPGAENNNIKLRVFDVTGKIVLKRTESVSPEINHYNLDLHNLTPGTYMIEVFNGRLVSRSKFLLVKKE